MDNREKCILIMCCSYLLDYGSDSANEKLEQILKPYTSKIREEESHFSKMEDRVLEIVNEFIELVYGVHDSKKMMLN